MFAEAWRIGRDWFYDENMHGVDWDSMGERYGALLWCAEEQAKGSWLQDGLKEQDPGIRTALLDAFARADTPFRYVAAWAHTGVGKAPKLHKEPLTFEEVKLTQRSYK